MKIVIADGVNRADYIISLFNTRQNELVVINEDEDTCRYLSLNNDIAVMRGRCTRENEMIEAGAENSDLFIALSEDDYRNYVACKLCKERLNIKRCIATVMNPKNVNVFKKLGIDSVICSTYRLGQEVSQLTTIENLIYSLSLEDDKISIIELMVTGDLKACGKTLSDINISDIATISSIVRQNSAIIPNGQTVLEEGDKVLIVTTADNKNRVLKEFRRKNR